MRSAPGAPSPGRRWLFRGVLLLLPLLSLSVIELGLRWGGYGFDPHFFKLLRIAGEDAWVQNEQFTYRFFPPSMARNPGPVRFPAHKAPGTYRIFILGESAAMGDPAESFAPDRYLEALLREKYPDRQFEVINTAITAINSHVILPIARDCAAREGDLWIVYMGNNEMVGPYGAATVFGRQAPPLAYARLATALQQFRLGQWLAARGRSWLGQDQEGKSWGGMEMFLRNQIPPDSPRRETVYHNFQQNLDAIVRCGLHSGATVLLNTVGVNLRDCPPFASLPGRPLEAAARAEFGQCYTNGLRAAAGQQWAAGAQAFAQAAQWDDRLAELHYRWADCLRHQTNLAEARVHFQLACDDDALPFRADSRINAALRTAPQRIRHERLLLCDAEKVLTEAPADGICGNETFFEHVHFDFDARYRLARAWAEQIASQLPGSARGWLTPAECEQRLGLTPWNRSQVLHFMVERMQAPPLQQQAHNEERRAALEARIQAELTRLGPELAARCRPQFEQVLAAHPGDFFVRENYAVFLELAGDLAGAAAQWGRFRETVPQDPLGYFEAGRLLVRQQQAAEAEGLLRQTLAIRPSRTDGWVELGNALALQQKYAEALAAFDTALKQDARDAQALLKRGKVLARLNRHAEAVASYQASLALNPADGLCHHELAIELMAAGQAAAAGEEFRQAAQCGPDSVILRYDYGAWLLRQQRWADAQAEFMAVGRLDPGNPRAQKQLAWLQAKLATRP